MKTTKHLTIKTFLITLFSVATVLTAQQKPEQHNIPGADDAWLTKVKSALAAEEYYISYSNNMYQSPNRANELRHYYFDDGFRMVSRKQGAWEVNLTLTGITKGSEALVTSDKAIFEANKEKLLVHHSGFTIEYINTTDGMRQNFVVHTRPSGNENLTVEIEYSGTLNMIKKGDGDVLFYEQHPTMGTTKSIVWYRDLNAWDARHKKLRSHIEINGNKMSLVVDDNDAIYPVTIDPITSTPNWQIESNQVNAWLGSGTSISPAGDVNGDGYSDVIVAAYSYDNSCSDCGMAWVYHGSATGLSTTAAWSNKGGSGQNSANFGYSVSTAGDVNGDGFSDILIGARYWDNGQTNEGMVFIFHGSSTGLATTAIRTLEGNQANANFGYAVGCAGDVNNDGYSDIIVGAPYYDNGHTNEGRAYVYHGSSTGIGTTANWTKETDQASSYFGFSVAPAGDVNGDNYSDIIIGSPYYDITYTENGKAWIYHGSSTGVSASPSRELEGDQNSCYLGYSVATAGDINGDGYSDIVVGAPYYDNGSTNEGRIYVHLGSSTGVSATVHSTKEGNLVNAYFGLSISTAGDINGDGYADIIIGAYGYNWSYTSEGRSFIYLGSSSGLQSASTWEYSCGQADAISGYTVSCAGDVNGDGFSDVLVSAPNYMNGEDNEGRVYAFYGGPYVLNTNSDDDRLGGVDGAELGYCVAAAGDVNGDGYSDVAVGLPNYDNGQTNEGRVYIYHGSSTGLASSPSSSLENNIASSYFGYSVASAGNVNNDNYADLIVGAYGYSNGQSSEGAAYVYLGTSGGISTSPVWTYESNIASTFFGINVASAGDVNGDGYSDIVIGGYFLSNPEPLEGGVWVFHGNGTGVESQYSWFADGDQNSAYFGYSVASAGDVNRDGYSDVIIGTPYYDNGNTNEGKATVYLGSSTGLATSPVWTLEKNTDDMLLGSSVASAGDINGDGYSDVIIGCPKYQTYGRVYVYKGYSAGISSSGYWYYSDGQTDEEFGVSVSSAGDVNGDGYSDILIGAKYYDNAQTNEGKAYLFLGSASGISASPDWEKESNQASAYFGRSVSSAGDINGDGYSDIVIGASGWDGTYAGEGLMSVFYGNKGADNKYKRTWQLKSSSSSPIQQGNAPCQSSFYIYHRSHSPIQEEKGKLVWELVRNAAFSGNPITNSVTTTGSSASWYTLTGTGYNISENVAISSVGNYRWRVREMYNPVTMITGQKYSKWFYYGAGSHDSWNGNLRVTNSPTITSDPTNSTICENSSTSFTVAATGDGILYQWQYYNGSSWVTLSNGGIYSGVTTNTLSLTTVTRSYNGIQYRCYVSGSCGDIDYSSAATLTVNTPPEIGTQPSNSTICAGQSTSFTVVATGAGLTYVWQVSTNNGLTWNNITAAGSNPTYSNWTTATLGVSGTTTSNNGYMYKCIISGTCTPSPATSSSVRLYINSLPSVTNPSNSAICAGGNTSFAVTGSGTGISYQWQVNTGSGYTNISSAGSNPTYSNWTTATLNLTNAAAGNNGYLYRCVVSGTCTPAASSSGATLTVNTAHSITGQPVDRTVCVASPATFGVTVTGTATYQWQVSTDGGSNYNNITSAGSNPTYSGWTAATLSLSGIIAADSGYRYKCVVSGPCASSVESQAKILVVKRLPAISTHPGSYSMGEGSDVNFAVVASGSELTYQWQEDTSGSNWANISNGGKYSGASTNTLEISNITSTMNGYNYRCVVSGYCTPSATSNAGTLTVTTAPAITGQPANSAICSGANTYFDIDATGTITGYQWKMYNGSIWSDVINGGVYSGATTDSLRITGATTGMNGYQYRCVVSGAGGDATSSEVTLTVNTGPVVTTNPSNVSKCAGLDAVFNVSGNRINTYQWQRSTNGGASWSDISGETGSSLTLTGVSAGMDNYRYRAKVYGTCSPSDTSASATLTVNSAPVISAEPANRTICANQNTLFRVTASGTSLTYQWYKSIDNGFSFSSIFGSNNDTLYLNNVPSSDNATRYLCVVSGTCSPNDTSAQGILTVNTVPVVTSDPLSQSVCEGDPVTFTVSATGTTPYTYTWKKGTTTIGPNSNSYLIASPTTADAGNYRCIISNACGADTSADAALTINTNPSITGDPSPTAVCRGSNSSFTVTASGTTPFIYQWKYNSTVNVGSSGSTLTIFSTDTSQAGLYSCNVSNTCGDVTSNEAMLTVNIPPAIVTQPSDQTACQGLTANFSLTASGSMLTHQWQRSTNGGATYSNLAGETSSTLTVSSVTPPMSGYKYRCIITGACTPADTSDSGTLTVYAAPAISVQPAAATVCEQGDTSFSVTASGQEINYQWQSSDDNGVTWDSITGANASTLLLNAVSTAINNYRYRVIVNGSCTPSVTSANALLTVNALPIVNLGNDTTICYGNTVTIDAGAGFSKYSWSTGTSTQSIIVDTTGVYFVEITNVQGCKNSSSAKRVTAKVPHLADELCMVSIDPDTYKNMIVWERTRYNNVHSYVVYKLMGVTFQPQDTIPFDTISVWVDINSSPRVKSEQYKISVIDSCGNTSELSPYHETMNLSILSGRGTTNVTLLFNKYIDESSNYIPEYYYIYRGLDSNNLTKYDSISGLIGSNPVNYNFTNAQLNEYYQVIIRKNCAPATLKASSGPFSQSLSNLEDNRLQTSITGDLAERLGLNIFPNPYNEQTTISYSLTETAPVKIEVSNIIGVKVATLVNTTQEAGAYNIKFSAEKAGVYTVKVTIDKESIIKRIVQVK